jgi:hypothetical protein
MRRQFPAPVASHGGDSAAGESLGPQITAFVFGGNRVTAVNPSRPRTGRNKVPARLRLPPLTALCFVLPALRFVSALFRSGLFLFLPDAFPVLVGARFGLGALFVRLLIRVRTLIVHAMPPSS